MANLTPGHRRQNMTINTQAWQPIAGTGSAQQSFSANTANVRSVVVPSAAVGMIITADVDVSIALRSTFVATASQGYLLAALTPSPALMIPRHGDLSASKSVVRWTAINTNGRINFMFLTGRGG